jgi:hypothetical protein
MATVLAPVLEHTGTLRSFQNPEHQGRVPQRPDLAWRIVTLHGRYICCDGLQTLDETARPAAPHMSPCVWHAPLAWMSSSSGTCNARPGKLCQRTAGTAVVISMNETAALGMEWQGPCGPHHPSAGGCTVRSINALARELNKV